MKRSYFDCVFGAGGGGTSSIEVTCDSSFAGLTITCTDGSTTLTQTCPSASPYEISFNIPNDGEWTISGTISGVTYSENIVIPPSVNLLPIIRKTITVHGAISDTIIYTDLLGDIHAIILDSNGAAIVQIPINGNGSTYTFSSSIAKDPTNLAQNYEKSITIDNNTTDIYVCPDGALYWYGYEKESMTYTKDIYGGAGTKNTNNFTIGRYTAATNNNTFFASSGKVNLDGKTSLKAIIQFSDTASYLQVLGYGDAINLSGGLTGQNITPATSEFVVTYNLPSNLGDKYVGYQTNCYPQTTTISAIWLE